MKKRLFILLSSTVLLMSLALPIKANMTCNADSSPTVGQRIQSLISHFKQSDGKYTKKTTIGLNEAAINNMSACFHCNETAAKRTTYYTPGKLLLAAEDGSIPVGSGAYIYADGEVKRAGALEGANENNMWEQLGEAQSVGQLEATCLEDYYVTLDTFLESGYFDNWSMNGDVFYYNLSDDDKVKDANDIYSCNMWNDFLYFCAPMLYKKSGYYLNAKSLTITADYDTYNNEILTLSMYLDDIDSGKLNQSYLAQARIYEGNKVFVEDLGTGYFLNINSNDEYRFNIDPENNEHLMLKDIQMSKDDEVIVWATNKEYYGVSRNIEHNLTVGISGATGFEGEGDYYIIPEDGLYDFYIDFTNDGSYKKLYVNDKSAMTIYVSDGGWTDIDGSRMWARYYSADSNESEITTDVYKPAFVDSHRNEYNQQVHKITIPGEAKYIQICYNKTDNDYVVTKRLEIKYEEYNGFYFDQWNGGGENITFGTWNYPADRV